MMMMMMLFVCFSHVEGASEQPAQTQTIEGTENMLFCSTKKIVSRSRRPKSSTSSCCAKTRSYMSLIRRSVSAALVLASRGKIETRFPARVAHPRGVLEGVAHGVQWPTRLGRGRYLACLGSRVRFPRRWRSQKCYSGGRQKPKNRSRRDATRVRCVGSVSYTHLTLPTILRV